MTVYGDSPSNFGTGASTYPTDPAYAGTGGVGATENADSTANNVKDKVGDAAGTVKDKVGDAAGTVKDKVTETAHSQVDTRSTQAGDSLAGVADQARDVSGQLRERGSDTAARLVESAAVYTDRAAQYLRASDGQTILNDIERYARRQPWAVAVGGLVAGFAASRVIRASRSNLDTNRVGATSGNGYNGSGGYGTATDTINRRDLDTRYGGYTPTSDPVVGEPIYAGMPSTVTDPTLGDTSRGNF